ncbi:MAG TPA: DUF6351 family protein [Mycobacteriales bacterium]|nr:DUF6351 family protein [Mycobacteriales bacterium]
MTRRAGAVVALLAGCVATAVVPSVAPAASPSSAGPRIIVLSSRPAWASGPDALVAVVVPGAADLRVVRVTLGRHDVTRELRSGRLQGLLTGVPEPKNVGLSRSASALVGLVHLTPGHHMLRAVLPNGRSDAVGLTDYPDSGPMFAGRQVTPWICNDASKSADCAAPTRYTYYYLPLAAAGVGNEPAVGSPPLSSQFLRYDPSQPPSPAAVARTTTDDGVTVPYVVRVETGVLDRDTYRIAVLAAPGRAWKPWHTQPAWNHKVDVEVGGDCRPWHDQAAGLPVFDAHALSRGYAVMAGGLETLGDDCNPVVAAESLAMVKTRLIDEYGVVRYTVGEGCSGGSIVLNAVTANYPGIIDGLLLMCSFPDIWQVAQQAEDCHLLDRVFDQHPLQWSVTLQDEVTGFLEPTTCRGFFDGPQGGVSSKVPDYARSLFDPSNGAACTAKAGAAWVYNATTNPAGARCTLQDYQVAIWGRRPRTSWSAVERRIGRGFANRPFDNVGVQYGLAALNHHHISVSQFLALNRAVGGLDIDWGHTTGRSVADHAALAVAYRTGQVLDPHAQADVPIIDLRGQDNEEIHLDIDSYVERARLDAATGGHRNQALWLELGDDAQDPTVTAIAFDRLDSWLSAIQQDRGTSSAAAKVAADRPAGAVDSCWLANQQITTWTDCQALFAHGTDPRIAAGGPLQDNVLKCALSRPKRSAYAVAFTSSQWGQLKSTFPTGVCDYSRPSVGARSLVRWPTFG